jgi:predicted dehydrogenase
MLRVGIVGVGFMGMIHYLAYEKVRGAKVTAVATRDKKKLAGDWRSIKGNFGPPGQMMDLSALDCYEDWRALIADPKIDLVDISLPPKLHAQVTKEALAAGKHVLVEKPISLTVKDGKQMVEAARKAKRQLLIGQVLPFFPEYAQAYQLIKSGKYGRLLGGHFKRVIAEPHWMKDFFNLDAVGGPLIDLHIHDAHFIRLVCGMPTSVFSTGRLRDGVVEFFETQFLYPDMAVTASGGVISPQGRSFTHGFEIHLEGATLVYDFAVVADKPTTNIPFTILGPKGQVTQPKLPAVDAFVAELTEVTQSIKRGMPSELLSGALALDALELCHKQAQSVASGKLVKVK